MKKKILILQFRTDLSLKHEIKCIHRFIDKDLTEFVNIFSNEFSYPELIKKIKKEKPAVIIAGSGEYYIGRKNDTHANQQKIDDLLKNFRIIVDIIFKYNLPCLGICFGHQLISFFRGAKIKYVLKNIEAGVFPITLNENGKKSRIFKGFPDIFDAVLGHQDSVVKIPNSILNLASSKKCKYQAFQYSDKIFSVQFHPELNRLGLKERFAKYPSYAKMGINFNKINASIATKVINNFIDIVNE